MRRFHTFTKWLLILILTSQFMVSCVGQTDRRLTCQQLMANPNFSYQPVIKISSDLSKVPSKYRDFVNMKLSGQRKFASSIAGQLDSYMAFVLSTPWKERYARKLPETLLKQNKKLYLELKSRDNRIADIFHEEIMGDGSAFFICQSHNGMADLIERYFSTKSAHDDWRKNSAGDMVGGIKQGFSYGHKISEKDSELFLIYISKIDLTIYIPVVYNGHYVCDLMIMYVLPDCCPSI